MYRSTLLALILLTACGTLTPEPPSPAQVPAAFEERSKSYRSSNNDVVQELFESSLEEDTALAHLLERIERTEALFADSAEGFHQRLQHDELFYASAQGHVTQLTDSLDRLRWLARIQQSRQQAEAALAPWSRPEAEWHTTVKEIAQLRTALMLDRALERMEAYQQAPVPGRNGMNGLLRDLQHQRDALRAQLGAGH